MVAPLLAGALLFTPAAAAPAGVHPISIAPPAAEGPAREVVTLADLPSVKVVSITLRSGTALPEHTAAVPVTIEVVHGAVTLVAGGASFPLAPGALVVLDANTPHAVTPAGTSPVTVLVHHHKAAR